MPVKKLIYNPPFLFRSGHFNTIWSYVARDLKPLHYIRTTLKTVDGDFIEIDQLDKKHEKCAILVHGLEGSSRSGYITSLTRYLRAHGWDITCLNLRGCSGSDNNLYNSYHSGIIADLDLAVKHISENYQQIAIVGFSLGGNLVLKYMADPMCSRHGKVVCGAAVSAPCHLSSSSDKMEDWQNYIYSQRFLKTLKKKLFQKAAVFPGQITFKKIQKIKTIRELDDVYTGPANGYKDAEDYYTKCSSLFSLSDIKTPTLLINAEDDPFLTAKCMPYLEAEMNNNFHFYASRYGGHVGFISPVKAGRPIYELCILDFFSAYSS